MQNLINAYHDYVKLIAIHGAGEGIKGLLTIYFLLAVFTPIQVILHEFGHCSFGWITGFKLVTFRIGSFVLVIQGGKGSIKRYSSKGSAGQCLMSPSVGGGKQTQFLGYLIGGIIIDFIVSIIVILLAFSPLHLSFIYRILLISIATYELSSVLMNGIPRKDCWIENDGTNIKNLMSNSETAQSWYFQLDSLQKMQEGIAYQDLGTKVLLPEGIELNNSITAYHKLMEYWYHLDTRQWNQAMDNLLELDFAKGNFSRLIQHIICIEKLFMYIKMGKASSEIEDLYSRCEKELKKKNGDFHMVRILMAYELYQNGVENNQLHSNMSLDHRNRMNLCNSCSPSYIKAKIDNKWSIYPYKGEALLNIRLMEEMLDKEER